MTAIAMHVLHENFGRVGLEGHTVVAVIDDALLDDDITAAIRIPSIGVLRLVLGLAVAGDVDTVKNNVGSVMDERVV